MSYRTSTRTALVAVAASTCLFGVVSEASAAPAMASQSSKAAVAKSLPSTKSAAKENVSFGSIYQGYKSCSNLPTLGYNPHRKSTIVKDAQYLLWWASQQSGNYIKVDGVYGKKTVALAKRVQRVHHLHVDGIVGPRTWAVMTFNTCNLAWSLKAADGG